MQTDLDWNVILRDFDFSKKDLLRIHWELSCWEFPKELENYKPEGFDEMPEYLTNGNLNVETKYNNVVFRSLLDELKRLTTDKERKSYLHVHVLGRTKKEFYVWWYKKKFCEFFKVGVYGKRWQNKMYNALREISKEDNQRQLKKIYGDKL